MSELFLGHAYQAEPEKQEIGERNAKFLDPKDLDAEDIPEQLSLDGVRAFLRPKDQHDCKHLGSFEQGGTFGFIHAESLAEAAFSITVLDSGTHIPLQV